MLQNIITDNSFSVILTYLHWTIFTIRLYFIFLSNSKTLNLLLWQFFRMVTISCMLRDKVKVAVDIPKYCICNLHVKTKWFIMTLQEICFQMSITLKMMKLWWKWKDIDLHSIKCLLPLFLRFNSFCFS